MYSVRLGFWTFNNDTEYEAVIVRWRVVLDMRAKRMMVKTDSQLVANQVEEDIIGHESRMVKYLEKVKWLMGKILGGSN